MTDRSGLLSDLPQEMRLLCFCARVCFDGSDTSRIETPILADLDWSFFLTAAYRHGMLPIVHRALQAIGPEYMPACIRERMQATCLTIARRNLAMTGELIDLLSLFHTHGIRALAERRLSSAGWCLCANYCAI